MQLFLWQSDDPNKSALEPDQCASSISLIWYLRERYEGRSCVSSKLKGRANAAFCLSAPILLRLSLCRWRIRIFDLDSNAASAPNDCARPFFGNCPLAIFVFVVWFWLT